MAISDPKKPSAGHGDPLSLFAKDKNKYRRDGNTPKRGGTSDRKPEQRGRKSFNPNFSEDNKLVGQPRQRHGEPEQARSFDRKPFSPRIQGRKEEYTGFPAAKNDTDVRLNRFIAVSGICSRREADELISAGKVTVNGRVVTELGSRVQPDDEVMYDGRVIRGEKKVYILMNKPKGFVTTIEDPHADRTVIDIIRSSCKERVYPVGRLDKNSLGVLLITNDGELTEQLTHPSYRKKKIYQASLDKPLTKADLEAISTGIELEDGFIRPDAVDYAGESRKEVGIEIHSGRNRIVRRIFESRGYKVVRLDRVYFAGLTKKALRRGAWRFLTPKEVAVLRSGEYE